MFAEEYPRDGNGWILFPGDVKDRRNLFFPEEVMKHPAKMNFYLQMAVIDYVSKEGDVLLDPFGGTGTLMVAALEGRRVVIIDVEENYYKLELQTRENLYSQSPGTTGMVSIINGDCRMVLPLPCDHIITSPPYAHAMNINRVRKKREDAPDDWLVQQDEAMLQYSKSPRNISKLNTFMYNMEMERVYRLCFQSLKPGGTMTTIVKDRIEKGERVYLSKWVDNVCKAIGFTLHTWEKWKTPGHGFTKIAKSKGREVVEDEDIMIYRKPVDGEVVTNDAASVGKGILSGTSGGPVER